jgi:hypothetical protein
MIVCSGVVGGYAKKKKSPTLATKITLEASTHKQKRGRPKKNDRTPTSSKDKLSTKTMAEQSSKLKQKGDKFRTTHEPLQANLELISRLGLI